MADNYNAEKFVYGIPLSNEKLMEILNNPEEMRNKVVINVHDIESPSDDVSKKCKAVMRYIRNTNLLVNEIPLTFASCAYEEKESFLKLFITDKMIFRNSLLKHTWEKILFIFNGADLSIDDSILSNEEIDIFIKNNEELVMELFRFIISLPIAAINFFNEEFKDGLNCEMTLDINTVEYTETDILNIHNIITFLYDDEIVYLMSNNNTDIEAVYYEKYFYTDKNPYTDVYINQLPFFNLMNYMFVGDNQKHISAFEENLDKMLNEQLKEMESLLEKKE